MIIVSLTLFGVLIFFKVRRIIRVLNNLNNRLDTIGQRLGPHSGESEKIQPSKFKLESQINSEAATDARKGIETNSTANISQRSGFQEHRTNAEVSIKIYELLF